MAHETSGPGRFGSSTMKVTTEWSLRIVTVIALAVSGMMLSFISALVDDHEHLESSIGNQLQVLQNRLLALERASGRGRTGMSGPGEPAPAPGPAPAPEPTPPAPPPTVPGPSPAP